jgi:hypothetical protein
VVGITPSRQATSTINNNRREAGPLQTATPGPLQVAALRPITQVAQDLVIDFYSRRCLAACKPQRERDVGSLSDRAPSRPVVD